MSQHKSRSLNRPSAHSYRNDELQLAAVICVKTCHRFATLETRLCVIFHDFYEPCVLRIVLLDMLYDCLQKLQVIWTYGLLLNLGVYQAYWKLIASILPHNATTFLSSENTRQFCQMLNFCIILLLLPSILSLGIGDYCGSNSYSNGKGSSECPILTFRVG